ncbi:MAG: CRTAC1 family protein [Planctomycetes bacterium]|nr:CRTAC1 family protein [Planctomycetota bacterium]
MIRRTALLLRWTAVSGVVAAAALLLALRSAAPGGRAVVAGDLSVEGLTDVQRRGLPPDLPRIRLREAGREAGLLRAPFAGRRTRALPEDMGTGVALADFDGDGDLDLLLAGSGPLGEGGPCLLYRNDGGLRFADVSAAALPAVRLVGMGAAAADADGDGDVDAFVSGFGDSLFLRNRGDGTFEDGTDAAGLRAPGFGASAAWADLDGDGDLDLYLCRYVEYRDDDGLRAAASSQYGLRIPAALNPSTFPPAPNLCFRNRGDGTFEEVAGAWGIANPAGRSLGVAAADLDDDGLPEVYVANDVSDNALFRNLGGGRFEDASYPSCTADYRGAMGIAVEDLDGDALPEILVTHWLAQENALYHNLTALAAGGRGPSLFFTDAAEPLGLGSPSLDGVKWGAVFSDLEGDGAPDLLVACGSTFEEAADPSRLRPEPPLLFWNGGARRGFFECVRAAGEEAARPRVARGLAAGDLDGDGDEDFVATVHGEPPLLLVNETPAAGPRITVRPRGRGGNTRGIGARVAVTAAGRTRVRRVGASPSYLSTSSTDLVFGLGGDGPPERVEVRFPSGAVRILERPGEGLVTVEE